MPFFPLFLQKGFLFAFSQRPKTFQLLSLRSSGPPRWLKAGLQVAWRLLYFQFNFIPGVQHFWLPTHRTVLYQSPTFVSIPSHQTAQLSITGFVIINKCSQEKGGLKCQAHFSGFLSSPRWPDGSQVTFYFHANSQCCWIDIKKKIFFFLFSSSSVKVHLNYVTCH